MVVMDAQLVTVTAGQATLKLIGELDRGTIDLFEDALASAGANGATTLDLAELSFIDSAGLHALVRHADGLNGQGPLTLSNSSDSIRRLFEIVGLDKHQAISIR